MTAITTSKKLQDLAGSFIMTCAALLGLALLLSQATAAHAVSLYANGDNINLATGRSNTYSTGAGYTGTLTAPTHPTYGGLEFRANDSANGPYWQVNFPTPYSVGYASVETYEDGAGINTMNFQTTVDGVNWVTQASPSVVDSGSSHLLAASFTPVSNVVGVRLVSTSWDDNAYRGIMREIRITGANDNLPLYYNGKTEFSVAQAPWNDGVVQSAPGWSPYSNGGSLISPIDDFTTGPRIYDHIIYHSTDLNPAPIDLLLNDNYDIDTVAITSGTEVHATGRTATQVDISYSSAISGAFTPILTNVPLLGSPEGHYVIDLGGTFDARRLRFDFSHPGSPVGDTFITELSAYAVELPVPAPEPTSVVLLGAGLGLLAMKRRRQNKAARAAQA